MVYVIVAVIVLIVIVAYALTPVVRGTLFRKFQLPRMARECGWIHRSLPRELSEYELYVRLRDTGVRLKQTLTHVEGTRRKHRFELFIFEFATQKYDQNEHRDVAGMGNGATLEVQVPLPTPEFEKWFRRKHDPGPVRIDDGRLKSDLGDRVGRKTFVRRMDEIIDIIEDWANNGSKRRT